MANATSPGTGDAQPRQSLLLTLAGPIVLLLGGALAIGGLFLPWYHSDARYLVGDPYPQDFQPYIPATSYGGLLGNGETRMLFVFALVSVAAGLICLLIDIIPILRQRWLLSGSVLLPGIVALLVGLLSTALVAGRGALVNAFATVPNIIDGGYFVSLVGYILLVPGAIMLMVGQNSLRRAIATASPVSPAPVQARPARRKSLGVALLLEWLIPGSGAMYVGQTGMGSGWLVGTYIGGLVLSLFIFAVINTMDELGSFPYQPLNPFPTIAIVVILLSLGICWLVARLLAVAGQVRAYNQQIAVSGTASAYPLPFVAGQVISGSALAILLSFILLSIAALIPLFGSSLPALLALAFWLALLRLAQVSPWRALLETVAGVALVQLVALLGSWLIEASRNLSFAPLHTFLAVNPLALFIVAFLLPIAMASGIGWGAALLFAPWLRVRRQPLISNSLPLASIALCLGVVVSLLLYPLHLKLLQPDVSGAYGFGTQRLLYFLLALALCAAGILASAVIAGVRLRRALAQQL